MTTPSVEARGLSIIVVAWNAAKVIEECLTSVLENPPLRRFEIIVLDNDSRDDTTRVVRALGGRVELVELGHNLGFAGACNEGYRRSRYEYLLFLNSDTRAYPSALEHLCRFLDAHPEAAAAGGGLLDVAGMPQVGFNVKAFPTLWSTAIELLMLDKLFPRNPVTRNQRMLDFSYSEVAEVDQPAGACFAVRRSVFETVGLFDERFYPAWFEDVDLCLRLRRQGGKIFFVPDARFLHLGGTSLEILHYGEFLSIWYTNLLRFFAKHYGQVAGLALRALVVVGMVARVLVGHVTTPRAGVTRREARAAYWKVAKESATRAQREAKPSREARSREDGPPRH